MNPSSSQPTNRLDELLSESMLRTLLPDEIRELEELAGTETDALLAHAEQAAASASIAFADHDTEVESIPSNLQMKLQEQAADHFASRSSEALPGPSIKLGDKLRLRRRASVSLTNLSSRRRAWC